MQFCLELSEHCCLFTAFLTSLKLNQLLRCCCSIIHNSLIEMEITGLLMNLKESMGHSHTSFPPTPSGSRHWGVAVTKGLRLSTFAVSISMYGSLDLASRVRSQGTCALGQTFSSYAFSARTSHGLLLHRSVQNEMLLELMESVCTAF